MNELATLSGANLIFGGFASIFTITGMVFAFLQGHRMRTYRRVPAIVVASEIETKDDSDGGKIYYPRITYVFRGSKGAIETDQTLFTDMGVGDRRWAEDIIERYPVGLQTSAYVHPKREDRSFIVSEIIGIPYYLILVSMLFVMMAIGLPPAEESWEESFQERAIWMILAWFMVGIASLAHFVFVGGRLRGGALMGFAAYLLVGVMALAWWVNSRMS